MAILIITFGTLAAGLVARGEPAGADARAYWAAVRIWLGGGDPYRPTGPFLPYVYAPWMLPVFAPWALLPWDVAWYVWRGGTILAFLWSVHWAYSRRPLTTALTVLVLAFPIGANLDTGNINLPLTLLLFAMPFVGPLAAGAIWAMATWMKWVPGRLRARHEAAGPAVGPAVPRRVGPAEPRDPARRRSPSSRRSSGSAGDRSASTTSSSCGPWCRSSGAGPTRSPGCGRAWWRGRWAALRGERRSRTRQVRGWVGIPYGSAADRRQSTPAAATAEPASGVGAAPATSLPTEPWPPRPPSRPRVGLTVRADAGRSAGGRPPWIGSRSARALGSTTGRSRTMRRRCSRRRRSR